jgi:sucrose-6-phosphate hydrolase SacC (GH32 family)
MSKFLEYYYMYYHFNPLTVEWLNNNFEVICHKSIVSWESSDVLNPGAHEG